MGLNASGIRKLKKRILTLTTSFPAYDEDPNGVFIARLINALQNLGYQIKVICPSDGVFHGRRKVMGVETFRFAYFIPKNFEKLTKRGGGIPENINNYFLAKLQLFPMMCVFLFRSLWESRGYDLVYANWLGAGIVGAIINLLTSKPLVVSFRGDDGYLARDRKVWRMLTLWVCARASIVAPVSDEIVRILKELGVQEKKLELPRFGVDTEFFRPPEPKPHNSEATQIIFVGSLIPRKGLHDLIEALNDERLKKVKLVVVGEGAHEERLKRRADSLGLAENIEWMGMVKPEKVAELMRTSDILCLPAYMEGRPNVVNEAMASGVPVITTRTGGIPDMVEEGETALLFEPGNVGQLMEHLITLVNDPERRRMMGRRAREFILESRLSWDDTAVQFDEIFKKILISKAL